MSKKPAAPEPVPARKPVSATTESASAIPLNAGSEIEQIRLNWRKFFVDTPDSRTPAAALLRSAKPKAIEADTIVLSFKYPLHKENMEKLENQKTAEKILSSLLGRPCRLRCVYEPETNHLVKAALRIDPGAKIINGEEK